MGSELKGYSRDVKGVWEGGEKGDEGGGSERRGKVGGAGGWRRWRLRSPDRRPVVADP